MARNEPKTRRGEQLPPEVSALLAQLSEDERAKFRPLLDGVVADLYRSEAADLWEQPDFAVSYWILVTTGVNQVEEMKVASEVLCWKHFFARDMARVRCVQSSDGRDMDCCLAHFGSMDLPTLIVGDSVMMSSFIMFNPDVLDLLISRPGVFTRFLSRVHQWLATGGSLRDLDTEFRVPGWWAHSKLGVKPKANLGGDAIRSCWSMRPTQSSSSRPPGGRLRWRPGEYRELARYVDRNAEPIEALLERARTALGAGFGGLYEMSRLTAPREIAAAVYEAIRGDTRLQYELEPPTPGEDEQEIRLAREVLVKEVATCIDLSLLFAAVLEAANSAPAVLIVRRRTGLHALGGFFESEAELDVEHVVTDAAAIRELIDQGKVRAVKTTGLSVTRGKKKPFDRACEEAAATVRADTPLALVNVLAGRKLGLHPPG